LRQFSFRFLCQHHERIVPGPFWCGYYERPLPDSTANRSVAVHDLLLCPVIADVLPNSEDDYAFVVSPHPYYYLRWRRISQNQAQRAVRLSSSSRGACQRLWSNRMHLHFLGLSGDPSRFRRSRWLSSVRRPDTELLVHGNRRSKRGGGRGRSWRIISRRTVRWTWIFQRSRTHTRSLRAEPA